MNKRHHDTDDIGVPISQMEPVRTCSSSTSTSNISDQSLLQSACSFIQSTSSESNASRASNDKSPSVRISSVELAELSRGVNQKDFEGNDCFDPRFYVNQIAVYQHNVGHRSDSVVEAETRIETGQLEMHVLAKRVALPTDVACWIRVRQRAHLGSGTFSDVYLGDVVASSRPPNGMAIAQAIGPGSAGGSVRNGSTAPIPVAIKKLWPDRSREDMQTMTHRLLNHHNIAALLYYYVCVHPTSKSVVWTLLLEPMASTMLNEQTRLNDQGRLMRMTYIKVFMYQTFSGLAYMERRSVLHRDIKPENLLIDMDSGQLKIGDFGSSKHYRAGHPNSPYQVTRYYRAPELCLGYRYYGPTVDIWAAGCILCQLLTNRTVFYGRDNDDQLMKIIAICGTPTRDQLQQCVPGVEVSSTIFRLRYPPANWYRILHRYNERVTADCADFVTKVLRYESSQRLRGERALAHPFFDIFRQPGCVLPNGNPLPRLTI